MNNKKEKVDSCSDDHEEIEENGEFAKRTDIEHDLKKQTPDIDFKKLRREQSKRDSTAYPFTRCHIEDCVFVKKVDEINDERSEKNRMTKH